MDPMSEPAFEPPFEPTPTRLVGWLQDSGLAPFVCGIETAETGEDRLHQWLPECLHGLLLHNPHVVVAGGALIHALSADPLGAERPRDIDVWILNTSTDAALGLIELATSTLVAEFGADRVQVTCSAHAISLHTGRYPPIQFVTVHHESAKELIDGFDLPVCRIARVFGTDGTCGIVFTEEAQEALLTGIMESGMARADLRPERARRYAQKGFLFRIPVSQGHSNATEGPTAAILEGVSRPQQALQQRLRGVDAHLMALLSFATVSQLNTETRAAPSSPCASGREASACDRATTCATTSATASATASATTCATASAMAEYAAHELPVPVNSIHLLAGIFQDGRAP
jgi:hypothetical protein